MKILVAEDDKFSRFLLKSTLTEWGYDVVTALNGREALEILNQEDAPRLVILDWIMPEMDGIQVLQEIRKRDQNYYVYVILLTAKTQKKDLISGLESGADDYLSKPFDSNELRLRLRAGRRIMNLLEELSTARKYLTEQATHDSLTQLYNRGAILEILHRESERAHREKHPLGIIMADVDHFKKINDTYGHIAGDSVLHEVAGRFTSSVRAYDAIGRYGGDEFIIVLPGCDALSSMAQAERILSKMNSEKMNIPEGMIPITGSFGVASSDLVDNYDPTTLIQAADVALYRAKVKGRNCVEIASLNQKLKHKAS